MITITIANQKGGTGKTTTAVHIAAGLAAQNCNVLALDLDTQSHLAIMLGVPPAPGTTDLLLGSPVRHHITHARPNLQLLPSDKSIQPALTYLLRHHDGALPADLLASKLPRITHPKPDYLIIDTGPAATQLQALALVGINLLIIPACCDMISAQSVRDMTTTLQHVDPDVPVLILPTFHTPTVVSNQALSYYRRTYPNNTLPRIQRATAIARAAGEQKTIFEHQPYSRAAKQYRALVATIQQLDLT